MNASFHSFRASDFPIAIEAMNQSGRVVWSEEVTEPGALYVPPLADEHGPVRIRVTYVDGSVHEAAPS